MAELPALEIQERFPIVNQQLVTELVFHQMSEEVTIDLIDSSDSVCLHSINTLRRGLQRSEPPKKVNSYVSSFPTLPKNLLE